MSIGSIAFVACKEGNELDILSAVVKKINQWHRDELDKQIKKTKATGRGHFFVSQDYDSDRWTNGAQIQSYDGKNFKIIFGCGDGDYSSAKRRMISFHTTCSTDYINVYNGHKVILSVNKWGRYKDIIEVVCKALKPFGEVYYTLDDYNDDFKKWSKK